MKDPKEIEVIHTAMSLVSSEAAEKYDKKIAQEKHDYDVRQHLLELEKIASELHASNELAMKQAEEAKLEAAKAKKKAFWASFRAWVSIGIAVISVAVSILLHFL